VRGDAALGERLARAMRIPRAFDPRSLTHGFHAWPARMHPAVARALVALAPPGRVVDPFMGGGTVIVEALLGGREAHGADINPVALEVAWARTRILTPTNLAALTRGAAELTERARAIRGARRVPDEVFRAEGEWFDPPALAEVWSLAQALREGPRDDLGRMLRACLSSLLVKASRQVSDSVPRRDVDHGWVPAGRVEAWFEARVEEHARNLAALRDAAPAGAPRPDLALADARRPSPGVGDVGALISSPPYPGVYDYVAHHERRYAILELDPGSARRAEIGPRREVRERGPRAAADLYVADMANVLRGWRERLRPDGIALLILGDGQSAQGAIPVLPLIERVARSTDMVVRAAVSQTRPVFGPGDARPRGHKEEHLVALVRAEGAA